MIQYEVNLNQGNEVLGSGKTITANEVLLTADEKVLAREIHHQNSLIPEDVAASVLGYFGKAAAQLMAMGFAIQFKNGQDVLMRIYPDLHIKGGNINLARAKQLDPSVTSLNMQNAGDLATKAGVQVRVRCETETKFTELLETEGYQVERKEVKEVAYVAKKSGDASDEGENAETPETPGTGSGTTGGNDNQGGTPGSGGFDSGE